MRVKGVGGILPRDQRQGCKESLPTMGEGRGAEHWPLTGKTTVKRRGRLHSQRTKTGAQCKKKKDHGERHGPDATIEEGQGKGSTRIGIDGWWRMGLGSWKLPSGNKLTYQGRGLGVGSSFSEVVSRRAGPPRRGKKEPPTLWGSC